MDTIQEQSSQAPFCVTLVDFATEQAREFEKTVAGTADSLQIVVRRVRHVSDTSYPAAVIHAIVLGPGVIAQVSGTDVDIIRSATNLGTCRVYRLDTALSPASPETTRLDEFIQRTRACGYTAIAAEVISFFREAHSLNKRCTLLAFRDMTCIAAYAILQYFWGVSYMFAVLHVFNAMSAITERGAWLGHFFGGLLIPASTFFGAFFIAHCCFVVVRNGLFAMRIVRGAFSEFAWGAVGFGTNAVATGYSIAVTDPSFARIFVSAILAIAVYAFYMYVRRVRGECTSLSQLQAAMADPRRREDVLICIGEQRFDHNSFPLFPFRSRALFISYMHGSQWSSDTAALVQQWASKQRLEVFLDRSTIPSGSLWRQSLLRAISECGFFVAVIDGDATMTEWVLAESAYAALLRKSIGKPRILLVIRSAQGIAKDKENPIHRTYLDVFQCHPGCCFGAAMVPLGAEDQFTEEIFLKAWGELQPMCLMSGDYGKSGYITQTEAPLRQRGAQFSLDDFQVSDRSWRVSVLLVMVLDFEGSSAEGLNLLLARCFEWIRSASEEKKAVGLNTLRFLLKGGYFRHDRGLVDEVRDVFLSDISLAVKLAALDLLGAVGTAATPLSQLSDFEIQRFTQFRAELMKRMNASQRAYAARGVHADLARECSGKTPEAALRNIISRIDCIDSFQV